MNDQQLIKYILRETSEAENQAIQAWINEGAANRKQFEQIEWIWKSSEKLRTSSPVDEHAAWQRFLARKEKGFQSTVTGKQRFMTSPWTHAAAAVVLVFASIWAISAFLPQSGRAYYSSVHLQSDQHPKEIKLLDGSVITMNKNSNLSYSQKLFGKQREVTLKQGEVFFDVRRNENKPFVIQIEEVTVQVLGTSFHVKKAGELTEVIVTSGSVAVSLGEHSEVLKPNDKLAINHETEAMMKSVPENQLYNYYVTKKFEAEKLPLEQLTNALGQAYGVEIEIQGERLKNRPITTTLEYGSLENNLQVITETLAVEATSMDGKIIIR